MPRVTISNAHNTDYNLSYESVRTLDGVYRPEKTKNTLFVVTGNANGYPLVIYVNQRSGRVEAVNPTRRRPAGSWSTRNFKKVSEKVTLTF